MKKTRILSLTMIVALALASLVARQSAAASFFPIKNTKPQWRAATYHGLTVGKSTRAAMRRAFGKPQWSQTERQEEEDESRQEVHHYERVGEFPGTTNVYVEQRRGIIKRMDFYPAKLTKDQAVAHFGADYLVTKYDFDPCPGNGDSEPLYESPNGPLVCVEYRARGIAIFIDYNHFVNKISYISGPIGTVKPRCKPGESGRGRS